jgi:replicative DNA helicase
VPKELEIDVFNEQVVLRTALASEARRKALVHQLSDSEFLHPVHAQIWRVLRALVDRGLAYSPDALRQLAASQGAEIDDDYVAELEEGAEAPNLEFHVDAMRWDATRARVLGDTLPALISSLETRQATASEVLGPARAVLEAIEGGTGRRDMHRPGELARGYKADVRERMLKGNFASSGYAAMDARLTEGFMPGRTTVLAGLPGSGKSTFIANLAITLAKLGRRVLVCAWEMPARKSLLDVMVCALIGLDMREFVQGRIAEEELAQVDRATDWICRKIRFMDNAFYTEVQKGRPNNDRNLDILAGYVAESGCDVVIMDLWERCLVDLSYEGITRALYRQQAMHVEYACHGIIVQQLRLKDVERRSDKRPTRESIKGTGAYVEVADLIFGVHRDGQFKRVPDDALEVICLKQRKGMPNWAVRFAWDPTNGQISGGAEVPYDPGLENVAEELGEVTDVAGIATKPRRRARATLGRGRDA